MNLSYFYLGQFQEAGIIIAILDLVSPMLPSPFFFLISSLSVQGSADFLFPRFSKIVTQTIYFLKMVLARHEANLHFSILYFKTPFKVYQYSFLIFSFLTFFFKLMHEKIVLILSQKRFKQKSKKCVSSSFYSFLKKFC